MPFIKNFDKLASTPERKVALELVETAFAAIQPQTVMESNFVVNGNTLSIQSKSYELSAYQRIFLVGFGKGSAEICRIIEQKLGDRLIAGWNIDVVDEKPFAKIKYTKGTHPLPSQENLDYTEKVLSELSDLTERDLILVVICGGGSVLFEKPHSVSLEKLQEIVKALLKSGATISEMNVIRKHLSAVKGGQFAKLLFPATVASLVFSDVPGNDLATIASGPTTKDTSTLKDVKEILEKYQITREVDVKDDYFTTTATEDKYFSDVKNMIIVSNQTALHKMQEKAQSLGYQATILTDKLQGDAHTLGKKLIEQTKPGQILLAGGESTIKVTGAGQGGRNQALVVSSLPYVGNDTIIAAFDSDGWDFYGFAGAIGDKETITKAKELNLNPEDFLKNDDSYHFLEKIGDGIDTGKLESNVSDLYVVFKK